LILRPRTLVWDLVLAQPGCFREMSREEAEHVALQVAVALEDSAEIRVEPVYSLDAGGSWLRIRVGAFALTVCGRIAGQPYTPLLFPDPAALRAAVEALSSLLRPPPGMVQ